MGACLLYLGVGHLGEQSYKRTAKVRSLDVLVLVFFFFAVWFLFSPKPKKSTSPKALSRDIV